MELVSGDVVLPEDILAVMLASMSFEDLLHKRQIPIFREATDSSITLDILARMYNLPKRDTFLELLEEYDKVNMTPRCLRYHSSYDCANYFASIGDLKGIMKSEELRWNSYGNAIIEAARGGHLIVFLYLQEKLYNSKTRQTKILMMEKNKFLDLSLRAASRGERWNIIDYLLDNGTRDLNYGLQGAAEGGNIKLMEYFVTKGANNWNMALHGATKGCNQEMVEYTIKMGADDLNGALYIAFQEKCFNIVNFLILKGANDFSDLMKQAAFINDKEQINYIIEKDIKEVETGLQVASSEGNKELIDFFIENGANNIQEALRFSRNDEIDKYLKSFLR